MHAHYYDLPTVAGLHSVIYAEYSPDTVDRSMSKQYVVGRVYLLVPDGQINMLRSRLCDHKVRLKTLVEHGQTVV